MNNKTKILKKIIEEIITEQLEQDYVLNQAINNNNNNNNDYVGYNNNIPQILLDKLERFSIAYVNGFINFGSIKKLYNELLEFITDPMEIVNIIYNSIIEAAKKYYISDKDKIKNIYPLLTSLAKQNIIKKGYDNEN